MGKVLVATSCNNIGLFHFVLDFTKIFIELHSEVIAN